MKILVTGAAGFIGFHVAKILSEEGHRVIGLDNVNDYYDVNLKYGRLEKLGVSRTNAEQYGLTTTSSLFPDLSFIRISLEDRVQLECIFEKEKFDVVCHLAAQAGVRYSLENPHAYIQSNIEGFMNILECCRYHQISHLVYASSSSVYGLNKKIPFESSDRTDRPASLYAATKKSNELMAHTYSHLFGLPSTGLRFFTVYGPWGRPDMALFIFTKAILSGKPIEVFNLGEMARDFTYIDDICEGVIKILKDPLQKRKENGELYKIYNIGNSRPVKLMDFIQAIERALEMEASKELMPMQPGDVQATWANVDHLIRDYGYQPHTPIQVGVQRFIEWYKSYYRI
ncbi:UDP-glucuronate 4-epimerase [Muriicola jejuensis]|uniref:NAD-dependent epimerase/dehydratase family protein n=1 Tax=Muriicola jejuensis TaxID=504488 RepID=A0A6P0UI42_9FLAO|nr:NAD-dependent epimerase [Muriicola jejuensis]NER11518.1 NAD-dependent epimerase/dehydratase family protein [Muriicola jejuensis]SMP20157.1 UDP-glucuronate 4-epimerase [Muriicola jejuensis]